MIDNTFIQSPEYQDYLDNKDQISEESVVFVEDKERLITQGKEYQFIPSGGNKGLILHKTEDGIEWLDIDIPLGSFTKEEADKLYLSKDKYTINVTYSVLNNTATITGEVGDFRYTDSSLRFVSLTLDVDGTSIKKRYYNLKFLSNYKHLTLSDEDDIYHLTYFMLDNDIYEIKLTQGYSDNNISAVQVTKITESQTGGGGVTVIDEDFTVSEMQIVSDDETLNIVTREELTNSLQQIIPAGGGDGQVLAKTTTGLTWKDMPRIWVGTQASFNGISKDPATLYFVIKS